MNDLNNGQSIITTPASVKGGFRDSVVNFVAGLVLVAGVAAVPAGVSYLAMETGSSLVPRPAIAAEYYEPEEEPVLAPSLFEMPELPSFQLQHDEPAIITTTAEPMLHALAAAPDAIADLWADPVTYYDGGIVARLRWSIPNDNDSAITEYEVHYSNDGFDTDDVTCVDTVDCDITDGEAYVYDMEDGVTYSFRVYAINAEGTSNVSNTAMLTAYLPGRRADGVLGQFDVNDEPSFVMGAATSKIARIRESQLFGMAIDEENLKLYISDTYSNMVLRFGLDANLYPISAEPEMIFGQLDIESSSSGTAANEMDEPTALAVDPIRDILFVMDGDNGRILKFEDASVDSSNKPEADAIIGANGAGQEGNCNNTAQDICQVNEPFVGGMALDVANDRLYYADSMNQRVLAWDGASTLSGYDAADFVIGISTLTGTASGATTQNTFGGFPLGIAYDATHDRLYVADVYFSPPFFASRVLEFDDISDAADIAAHKPNATRVFGQASFTTMAGPSGVTANTFGLTLAITADGSNDRLLVSDLEIPNLADQTSYVGRVMVFEDVSNAATFLEDADRFVGQSDGAAAEPLSLNGTSTYYHYAATVTSDGSRLMIGHLLNGTIIEYDVAGAFENMPTGRDIFVPDSEINRLVAGYGFARGATVDSINHLLYVTDDLAYGRVMVYELDENNELLDLIPDYVAGRDNLYSAFGTTMNYPYGVAVDPWHDRLYVADHARHAVFVFDTSDLADMGTPVAALGQSAIDGTSSGCAAESLSGPSAVAYDHINDRLFVADSDNHRVLAFDEPSTLSSGAAADHILGNGGNYSSCIYATTQSGFSNPRGLAVDTSVGKLYVSDYGNNRVLVYDISTLTDGENALNVLGQSTFDTSGSGTTQSNLSGPNGLTLDINDERLWVHDYSNYRILGFDIGSVNDGEDAVEVIGQPNFDTALQSTEATQASLGSGYSWIHYDSTADRLYVPDTERARVLWYDFAVAEEESDAQLIPDSVIGQYDNVGEPSFTRSLLVGIPSQYGAFIPSSVAFDDEHNWMFVADGEIGRVLAYELDAETGLLVDHEADHVLGKPDFLSYDTGVSANSIGGSYLQLAYDPNHDRLFVSVPHEDAQHILAFDIGGGITDGMDASYTIGASVNGGEGGNGITEYHFTSNDVMPLAYDAENDRLFVGDDYRVVVFDGTAVTTNMMASRVLLQPGFVTQDDSVVSAGRTGSIVSSLAYDSVSDRLFVGFDSRVLGFEVGTAMGDIINGMNASMVIGQGDYGSETVYGGEGITSYTLNALRGLSFDAVNDRLYLLDGTGLRTLVFDDMTNAAEFFEDAEHVIGQEDFTSIVADGAGLNMLTEEPYGLTYHAASDQLVVAALLEDVGRTLIFDVSTFEPGELAVDALSAMEVGMMKPEGVAIDTVNHRLFVTDSSRVLVFELDENNDLVDVYSDRALGVPTVHAIEADTSGVSADVFNGVAALAYDSLHNILYVEDYGNSRVLGFNVGASIEDITNGMSASLVFGQEDFISNIQEVDLDSIYYPGGIAVDEVGDRLFVADIFSNRVMVFENASMAAPGPDAVAIIGQEDYSANSGGSGTAALNTPAGVAYDAGNDRLFVADVYNNRVVVYDTSDVQEFSEPAAHVLGQVIFDDNDMNRGGVAAAGTLALPVALAYDQYEERLLVVEVVNSRALVYDLSGGITNGMDAVQVIGQPDFETTVDPGTDNATQNNFYILGGQTLSGATFAPNRLLFSDSLNARILVFGAGSSSSGGSRGGSGDIYPPTLHEIESAPLSTSEMRLTWVTNEASDSVVRYGITSAYGHTTTEPAFVTSHIVGLANLSPSTTYHFQVCSNDSFYNLGCSEDMTFTTPSIGEVIPEIGEDGEEESLWVPEYDAQGHSTGMFMSGPSFTGLGVTVSDVTRDSVTITWTTDEASGTHVEYGTGIPYSHDKVVDGLVTTHTVRLTGLSSGTTYHFRVASQGTDAMRSVSEDYTFRTN